MHFLLFFHIIFKKKVDIIMDKEHKSRSIAMIVLTGIIIGILSILMILEYVGDSYQLSQQTDLQIILYGYSIMLSYILRLDLIATFGAFAIVAIVLTKKIKQFSIPTLIFACTALGYSIVGFIETWISVAGLLMHLFLLGLSIPLFILALVDLIKIRPLIKEKVESTPVPVEVKVEDVE